MLLIYTPIISNRLKYVLDNIFREHLGIEHGLTDDVETYKQYQSSPKFTYAETKTADGLFLYASSLLFQNDIHEVSLSTSVTNDTPVLFAHNNKDSALSFDIFAAIFYLLSRYEEYLYKEKDEYGNFDFRQSILYKLNSLDKPLVEIWIELLKDVLKKNFPQLQFKEKSPRYALNFDIDVAYAYTNRGVYRTLGGLTKKLATLKFSDLKDHALTLLHLKKDMFDTYEYIFGENKNGKAFVFFNMGSYGKYDKNPSWKNKKFQELIRSIHSKYSVGLHPSYASNNNKKLLFEEKKKLEAITGQTITLSRQHYLKLSLPETYRNLLEASIQKDFTMGYYLYYGFRAGTCNPFYFFDLQANKATELLLYPFAVMDGTLNDVLKLSPENAKQIVSQLIDTVKKYKGVFIPLWHNSTLSESDNWTGWRTVFEHTIKELEEKSFQ